MKLLSMPENGWRTKNRIIKKSFQNERIFYFFTLMKTRILYFFIICLVIILGLLSRKLDFVPLFVGDIFYAMMIYFIVLFFLLKSDLKIITFISIVTCYGVEILQLYQANWIVEIRNTTFGHLVLGQGFLWSDLLAYTFGILILYFIENKTHRSFKNN